MPSSRGRIGPCPDTDIAIAANTQAALFIPPPFSLVASYLRGCRQAGVECRHPDMKLPSLHRRHFVFLSAAWTSRLRGQTGKRIPIGLQQTAVIKNIQQDLTGTL